jgi:very-short-patch-repair endonuclease
VDPRTLYDSFVTSAKSLVNRRVTHLRVAFLTAGLSWGTLRWLRAAYRSGVGVSASKCPTTAGLSTWRSPDLSTQWAAGHRGSMEIETFLDARAGAARASALFAAGFTRTSVGKAVAAGRIVRIRRGVYSRPREADLFGLALHHNALLTCLSAAPIYRLWTLNEAGPLHLSPGHKATPPGMLAHGRCLHATHPWLPVAGLADVLIHALRCLPELESLVMVQCAAQRGDITVQFLRRKLPGNRNARARAVLDSVIPRADSVLEVLANFHFCQAGLKVRRHVQLPGVGEVDFLIEDCLVVETDGGTHLEPRQVRKDRKRNNATVVGGHLGLRFGYDDVVNHPARMVAEVLAVLELRRRGAFDAR